MDFSDFPRITRLPYYVFNIVNELKMKARREGEDIIDLGMGNPDQPTPHHIVDKLIEAAQNGKNHRYSVSRGIYKLRVAISDWYKRRYDVYVDPETESIVTLGAKEGIAHLVLAMIDKGDVAIVPGPAYPIHPYSVIIAGGDVRAIPLATDGTFFEELEKAIKNNWPKPKLLILSFPHNPTTAVVDRDFFAKVVSFAKENKLYVIHDLAYADLVFDGYRAPSILEIPGAKDIAVEFFTLSKSYNMPGWRVGFAVGNQKMIFALSRIKSYLDYGMFQPIQIAAITALNGPVEPVHEIANLYKKRRDALIDGLDRIGWHIEKPKATMFVWAGIPEQFKKLGSLEFTKLLLSEGKVAVSPGIGFGDYGEGYLRFSLIENEERTQQAIRGIKKVLHR
ncbi:MAG: alanine transaminase [Deltaproteobacteria bacterium]|nr:alanine transaminase [Deltaproteobacteria bacterium]